MKTNKYRPGFTIVELIISIVVIAILATLSYVAYNGIQNNARRVALISDLDNAISVLERDYQKNGVYPETVQDANSGKGLVFGEDTTYQYTVNNTAIPPTFCLTATNAGMDYYVGSNVITPTEGACLGHINLVTNGFGELDDNTNFPSLNFDVNDFPAGAQGSFVSPNGNYSWYTSSEFIPVDPTHKYVLSGWARQQTAGITTSRWYFGLAPYDVDNKSIQSYYYMYRPGTTTTLSQPLNTGDTVVHLTNISNDWYDVAVTSPHFRTFIFWGYTDSTGKTWAPETYTMNGWYTDMYNGGVGAINRTNNTITLNKPWPGISYPAGHPVSNGGAGNSYMYAAASNQIVPETWQQWISPTITGTTPGGLNSSVTTFPQGTKSVRVSIGFNAGSPPSTSRQAVSGIRFAETE